MASSYALLPTSDNAEDPSLGEDVTKDAEKKKPTFRKHLIIALALALALYLAFRAGEYTGRHWKPSKTEPDGKDTTEPVVDTPKPHPPVVKPNNTMTYGKRSVG